MRAVVQRVREARVTIGTRVTGRIGSGLLVLIGAGPDDTERDVDWLVRKIAEMRLFDDEEGRMNRSVEEIGGAVLVVSQFTLYADTSRGRRPSFTGAMAPARAAPLIDQFAARLRVRGLTVATGEFGAAMEVALVNHGPVTLVLDSCDAG